MPSFLKNSAEYFLPASLQYIPISPISPVRFLKTTAMQKTKHAKLNITIKKCVK